MVDADLCGDAGDRANIVVVTEPGIFEAMRALFARFAPELTPRVVRGGATRQQSVHEGLRAVSDEMRRGLVHDGARRS